MNEGYIITCDWSGSLQPTPPNWNTR